MVFRLQWPIRSTTPGRLPHISGGFLVRPDIYTFFKGHEGIDFAPPLDTPVYACAAGTVYRMDGEDTTGYGNQIRIQHEHETGTYKTIYAHLNRYAEGLSIGDSVEAGELIGYVGSTGNSTGPHLHLMLKLDGATSRGETEYVRPDGVTITLPSDLLDPSPFLDPPVNTQARHTKANHPARQLVNPNDAPYEPPGGLRERPSNRTSGVMQKMLDSPTGLTLRFRDGSRHTITDFSLELALDFDAPQVGDILLEISADKRYTLKLSGSQNLELFARPAWLVDATPLQPDPQPDPHPPLKGTTPEGDTLQMEVITTSGVNIRSESESRNNPSNRVAAAAQGTILTVKSPAVLNQGYYWREIVTTSDPILNSNNRVKGAFVAERNESGTTTFLQKK